MCSVWVKAPTVAVGLAVNVNVMTLLDCAGISPAPSLVTDNPVGMGASKMFVISSASVSVPPLLKTVTAMSLLVPCVIVPQSRVTGETVSSGGVMTVPFPGMLASSPTAHITPIVPTKIKHMIMMSVIGDRFLMFS